MYSRKIYSQKKNYKHIEYFKIYNITHIRLKRILILKTLKMQITIFHLFKYQFSDTYESFQWGRTQQYYQLRDKYYHMLIPCKS